MGQFTAVFVKVDGLDETEILMRDLKASSLEGARSEALAFPVPRGAIFIKILLDGKYLHRTAVAL